ncbi:MULTISPECIES: pyrroline-5-carboxylate reductase [Chryseobacterium]|uniref:Pyrroline-5-carboxylate reductase n=1 Tax=Chryseobacterium camelliae TaxID=1265445 RepID=A0ABU0TK34_9FLAO|nr:MULTISPECIES: pyrroline-5-carboxylate reductase [Chryseobacterium]MDT3408738.1 pyrroline-5-carboxylate reductase [Pseudacidovorax intermedius]MDQ1097408.1 pyrroline-5-carboxylate reductase [Chryseobacterium camelliae]MDQ1101338.1 pyrroline-5-carboxylate reductase [Chryseobacterium sp. SORGH_AS_1048]MDR6084783.1 pyrroline-5-carboxylate reductase [Chryseobacterium sp. SORGH_AS_0909]MDR6129130.1 pyrroline-5-carboxylate reductase [Chryseobacterium sp. SORGH_AS_1175]
MKIAILGAGNMGLSFSKSFLKYELIKPENLHLITRNVSKLPKIAEEFPKSEISTFDQVTELDADIIIIAVKPQDFLHVAENFRFTLKKHQMVLSIMAGIKIEKIQNLLNHPMVVRAMPNSPTLLGMGITGYTAAAGISFSQLMNIERLLNSTGRSVYLEDEGLLDGVTALSGSGPAYFYYIIDAMIKAGVEMGIQENLSRLFVKQTMLGAYHLINNSDKNLEELISDVASKGGTTEAALSTFNENNLKDILKSGILNAEKRAKELNG